MPSSKLNTIISIVTKEPHILFLLGASFLVFIASTVLFASAQLVLGFSINSVPVILAFWFALLFVWLGVRRFDQAARIPVFRNLTIMFVLTLLVATFISGYYFDLSYDGQGYQQEGIIQLAKGWNPIYDKPVDGIHGMWINHYAKGPWLAAASLYKLIGHIEHAKVFNLIYIFASFLIALVVLMELFENKPNLSVLFAALFALNPVAVNQSFSFYCDGQLSSLITMLVALSFLIVKKPTNLNLFLYALVVILILNIKFTAIIYVTILVCALIAGLLLYKRKELAARVYIVATLCYIVGIVFVGFNPYITNTTQQGHPFYPLAGKNSVDIISSNMPADFVDKSGLIKLTKSIFAESSNLYAPAESIMKFPLLVRFDEIKAFGLTDVRIGGFGPLFGAVTLFSSILWLAFLVFAVRRKEPYKKIAVPLVCIAAILISGLVNPEVWWARYAPQLWMLPLVVSITVMLMEETKLMRKCSALVVAVIVLNLSITSTAYIFHQVSTNRILKDQLATVANSSKPASVDFNSFTSNKVRFKEVGIRFKETDNITDEKAFYLVESETHVLINE